MNSFEKHRYYIGPQPYRREHYKQRKQPIGDHFHYTKMFKT